jgi:hypothetical protein
MRRAHSLILALAACLPLAGCYYDPDYGYVRNGSGADAYYGEETTTVVSPGVYDPGYGYYGGGYGPGCCYSGVTVGTVWYDRDYDRRYYRRDRDWHGRPPPRGDWNGRPGGDHRPPGGWHGNNRPPGGWRGNDRPRDNDGDRGPRGGGWQGGNRPPRDDGHAGNRPSRGDGRPGGWQGGGNRGDGDHRPPSSSGQRSAPPVRQAGTGRDRSRFRSDTD